MVKNWICLIIILVVSLGAKPAVNNNEVAEEIYKREFLQLVNQLRKKGCRCGRKKMRPVPSVKWNTRLAQAAKGHAKDMANKRFFRHRGSDGSEPSERIERAGYEWSAVGENILWGESSARQVFLGWKSSPSHCKTMMNGDYNEMGVARSGTYWVQDFGKQKDW